MKNNYWFLLLTLFIGLKMKAQVADSTFVEVDSVEVDTVPIFIPENGIQNPKAIAQFLEKLAVLQKNHLGKINIVHIGDSHIQADLMTNKVRKHLQLAFGNAGRGFVFPHNLARTNGSWDIRFTSNGNWNNHKIVSTVDGSPMGISGIGLWTNAHDFSIELNAKEADNFFNTVKIITPKNSNSFAFSLDKRIIASEKKVPKRIVHKIKNGEAISIIAEKYNVSIAQIKKANALKNDKIRAGRTLKIPSNEMQTKVAERSEFIPLKMLSDENTHYFNSDKTLEKIYIIPNKSERYFELNGLVLDNNNSGILYHNIGVNGAKLSDYNKYPLFFEQLKALSPDLIIIGLGTNESFDKMNSVDYMAQLDLFIQNTKAQNPNVAILVATPPPSLFKRKFPNIFVADYAQKIINVAVENNYAVWDMYAQLGGLYGVRRNFNKGIIGKDRVHYSKAGYELQGDSLSDAILKAFENYIKTNN
jgi:LysM repeat protein